MTIFDYLQLASSLLHEHGLDTWKPTVDRAQRRRAQCRYRQREIGVSQFVLDQSSDEKIHNDILHEIAHALVGCGHHHDLIWRETALRIGSDGLRCGFANTTSRRWHITCECGACDYTQIRRSRIKLRCRRCKVELVWIDTHNLPDGASVVRG